MKLMWHIVCKDLRRLRWPLAAWLGLLVGKHAIGIVLIWGGAFTEETFRRLEIVTGALPVVEVLFAFFLTARLVHADCLVGSSQFWLTRPISGWRLLGAKILGVVVLILSPLLALAIPWWIACGVTGPWMAAAAVDLLIWPLVAIIPAFLVASLTNTFGRFFAWSLLLLWLTAMAPFYAQLGWARATDGTGAGAEGMASAQLLVAGAVMLLVVALVVTLQFLKRQWPRSVLALGCGGVFALSVGAMWVGEATASQGGSAGRVDWNAEKAVGVKIDSLRAAVDKSSAQSFENGAAITGDMRVAELPDGLALRGGPVVFSWRWTDVGTYRRSGQTHSAAGVTRAKRHAYGLQDPKTDPETEQWLRDQPPVLPTWSGPSFSESQIRTGTRLPLSLVARAQKEPTDVRMNGMFELLRPAVLIETRMQKGGWTAGGGVGMRVVEVEAGTRTATPKSRRPREMKMVTVVESSVYYLSEAAQWFIARWSTRQLRWWHWYGINRLVLNRSHGMGVVSVHRGSPAVRIAAVALQSTTFAAEVPLVRRGEQWVREHADWFDGAELAILDWVPVARFSRSVSVEEFKFAP